MQKSRLPANFLEPLAIIPSSDTDFYVDGRYHTRIAFTKDTAGKVSGAVLNPGPWEEKEAKILQIIKKEYIFPWSISSLI